MRIVVVGGSGFIGTPLVAALLARGHAVRIFDRAPSARFPDLVEHGDVRDAAAVRQALRAADAVVDLAAEHSDDVRPISRYFDTNVGGARNITAAAEHVPQLLFVSSVAVYGPGRPAADEQAALAPQSPYGQSKREAEALYRSWHSAAPERRALTVLRPTVVFGEGNHGNMQRLIEQLLRGRFVMVGRGDNRKSIAYVGNLVAFLVERIEDAHGLRCFNYVDPPDLATAELVQRIRALLPDPGRPPWRMPLRLALLAAQGLQIGARLLGRRSPYTPSRVRSFCAETTFSAAAVEATGFRRPYSLEQALRRTIAATLGGD